MARSFSCQLAKRIEQIDHLIRCDLDLVVDLVSIELQPVRFVQEFGVCHDRGEIVTQIMRDRSGCPAQSGNSFGSETALLGNQEIASHLREMPRQVPQLHCCPEA